MAHDECNFDIYFELLFALFKAPGCITIYLGVPEIRADGVWFLRY